MQTPFRHEKKDEEKCGPPDSIDPQAVQRLVCEWNSEIAETKFAKKIILLLYSHLRKLARGANQHPHGHDPHYRAEMERNGIVFNVPHEVQNCDEFDELAVNVELKIPMNMIDGEACEKEMNLSEAGSRCKRKCCKRKDSKKKKCVQKLFDLDGDSGSYRGAREQGYASEPENRKSRRDDCREERRHKRGKRRHFSLPLHKNQRKQLISTEEDDDCESDRRELMENRTQRIKEYIDGSVVHLQRMAHSNHPYANPPEPSGVCDLPIEPQVCPVTPLDLTARGGFQCEPKQNTEECLQECLQETAARPQPHRHHHHHHHHNHMGSHRHKGLDALYRSPCAADQRLVEPGHSDYVNQRLCLVGCELNQDNDVNNVEAVQQDEDHDPRCGEKRITWPKDAYLEKYQRHGTFWPIWTESPYSHLARTMDDVPTAQREYSYYEAEGGHGHDDWEQHGRRHRRWSEMEGAQGSHFTSVSESKNLEYVHPEECPKHCGQLPVDDSDVHCQHEMSGPAHRLEVQFMSQSDGDVTL